MSIDTSNIIVGAGTLSVGEIVFMGSFAVTGSGAGNFTDGSVVKAPHDLEVVVMKAAIGAAEIVATITGVNQAGVGSRTGTATIPLSSAPGTKVTVTPTVSTDFFTDVTDIGITGGTNGDDFEVRSKVTDFGATEGGVTVRQERSFIDRFCDQSVGLVKKKQTEKRLFITTNLLESTLTRLRQAWNISETLSSDNSVLTVKADKMADYVAVQFVGSAPAAGTRTLLCENVISLGMSEHSYQKDGATIVPVEFEVLPQTNWGVRNSDMEIWTSGASSAPDDWTLSGAGAAVARVDTTSKKHGTYAAELTGGGAASGLLISYLAPMATLELFKNKLIKLDVWCKCSTATAANIYIHDGATAWHSKYHTGGGNWECLQVEARIPAGVTDVNLTLSLSATNVGIFDYVQPTFFGKITDS